MCEINESVFLMTFICSFILKPIWMYKSFVIMIVTTHLKHASTIPRFTFASVNFVKIVSFLHISSYKAVIYLSLCFCTFFHYFYILLTLSKCYEKHYLRTGHIFLSIEKRIFLSWLKRFSFFQVLIKNYASNEFA